MTITTFLHQALAQYVKTALWSSTDQTRDDGGDPLDANFTGADLDPGCLDVMRSDVATFIACEYPIIARLGLSPDDVGHDLWLTRNGHGAGFWDRGYGRDGERLSVAAHAMGECDIYPGDDGRLYVS